MFYVFGALYNDNLTYFVDPEGANIFKFENEADKQFSLEIAQSTNPNFKAYRLLEE